LIIYDTWQRKVKTYNEYIDEGKFSYHSTKLKEGIQEILDSFPVIDRVMKECMTKGDIEGRHHLTNIRADMEQTCYRYECLQNGKEIEPFRSACDGNLRRYSFNRKALLEEKKYVPFNNTDKKENKFVSGLEKVGSSLKNGAFFVGRKIKQTSESGYNYVKDKMSDEPSNSNKDSKSNPEKKDVDINDKSHSNNNSNNNNNNNKNSSH
jgi:hypothetical protein